MYFDMGSDTSNSMQTIWFLLTSVDPTAVFVPSPARTFSRIRPPRCLAKTSTHPADRQLLPPDRTAS